MNLIKRIALGLTAVAGVAILSGCAGMNKSGQQLADSYSKYMDQPRYMPVMHLVAADGKEVTLNISGAKEITINSALQPLAAPMPPSSMINTVVETLGRFGLAWVAADFGKEAMKTKVVTQPQPMIVRPEVITTP